MDKDKFMKLCNRIESQFPSISEFMIKIKDKDTSDFDKLEHILFNSMYGRNEYPQYEKEGIAYCQFLIDIINDNDNELLNSMSNYFKL